LALDVQFTIIYTFSVELQYHKYYINFIKIILYKFYKKIDT